MKIRSSLHLIICALALAAPALLMAMGSTKLTIASTSSLPAATVGVNYSQILLSAGGTRPFTWTVKSGTLPAGIHLQAAKLVGKATVPGTSSFTLQVTDAKTHTASKAFMLPVKQ